MSLRVVCTVENMAFRLLGSTLGFALKSSIEIPCNCKLYRRSYSQCANKREDLYRRATGRFLYSSESPLKCWQCNYPYKSEIFCQKCKALQDPPENLNYFQVIGVREAYDIESKEMQRKYRELQNKLHPDRFSNRTEKEKRISENLSSLINKAYNTLLHPLERGLYMLKLQNLSIPEGTTNLDPEFLMEIMELNEKVEEASRDKEKVVKLIDENNAVLDTLSKEVSEAFRANDVEKAKVTLIKMKYYASLQSRLKNLKQDLGIVD